jgi:outer membrane immunogenic protein
MSRKKERRIMVRMKPTLLGLLLMLLLVGGGAQAMAQSTRPEGRITLESTSIAAGVGVDWGDGTLRFNGQDYKFSVSGLSLGDWGISRINAVGNVHNLARPADLAGTYVAGEAGVALAAGADALVLRNQNGVVITLSAMQEGVRLTLGPAGMTITLQ